MSDLDKYADRLQHRVAEFFDQVSKDRDDLFAAHPILGYEQQSRQAAVLELLCPGRDDLVLDIGCGNARDGRVLASRVRYWVGVDMSREMLRTARGVLLDRGASGALLLADGTALPFTDNTFDKVYCSEVIEHVPRWPIIIAEMERVLKPGGLAVITTPNRHGMYGPIRAAMDLLRAATRQRRAHPFDEWKTISEVRDAAERCGLAVQDTLGVCFVPGQWTYVLPRAVQRLILRRVLPLECRLRHTFPAMGYLIALSFRKEATQSSPI